MSKISAHIIDQIMQASQIEDVIGDFVNLKRAGSNLKGLSPFTDEKTPSFVVSPAKMFFDWKRWLCSYFFNGERTFFVS